MSKNDLKHCWFSRKHKNLINEWACRASVFYIINGKEEEVSFVGSNIDSDDNYDDKIYLGMGEFSRRTKCSCMECSALDRTILQTFIYEETADKYLF